MKMGNRRNKLLDRIGTLVTRKTELTGEPTNRAQRRRYRHALKEVGVASSEIDEDALFKALRERNHV